MVFDVSSFLGSYTYLVAEVVWGSIAVWLLVRTDSLERAAKSVAVLYPIGLLWDWYSLNIRLYVVPEPTRTGIEILGVPLEEHLFLIIVASFVIGIHENLNVDLSR